MKREEAIKLLESANKYANKLEEVLRSELGVTTHLHFEKRETPCGAFVIGMDTNTDVNAQMTSSPILRQLFKEAWLRIDIYDFINEVMFSISIDYKHNYNGGSNCHDLMLVSIVKATEEVIVKK